MKRRLAVKIAYFGPDFEGFPRQPGMMTVEGEVIGALTRIKAWRKGDYFMSSSRTDRGVSALENIVALDTAFKETEFAKALDSGLSSVLLLATAPAPPGFDPRMAFSRTYCYRSPWSGDFNIAIGQKTADMFVGCHDFASFCRKDGRPTHREILSCTIKKIQGQAEFRVVGKSFLWQQVRRMAGATASVMKGEKTLKEVRDCLEGAEGIFPPLPPEGLLLEKVSMPGLAWTDIHGASFERKMKSETRRTLFFGMVGRRTGKTIYK